MALLSEEAHLILKKSATVIDKKLLQEKNEMMAQSKLHQAKSLEKYYLRKASKWAFRGEFASSQTCLSSVKQSSSLLPAIPEMEGA